MRLWIGLVCMLAALAATAGVWVHYFPAPPLKTIVMATGTRNLAYYTFGQEYAKALKSKRIDVRVLPTRGSVDNLALLHNPRSGVIDELLQRGIIGADDAALLRDPKASVIALMQGGIIEVDNAAGLESLGAVFYEPVWLFRRRSAGNTPPSPEGINSLRGKTIAIGPAGSGIQVLASKMLERHGITQGVANLKSMDTRDAVDALTKTSTIDALFIVASWNAGSVKQLLADPSVELVGYPQADAYADHYPYLHKVVLHHGAIDFAADRPARDVALIAAKASLIVPHDLPLPIQYLLLNAAKQIHGQRNPLQGNDEFPSAEAAVPPLSAAAQQFYKPSLPYYLNSFLMTYLPFSIAEPMAEQIDNVITALFLIGTLGVIAPLVRLIPVIYNWATQRPIFRLLFDVLALEAELSGPGGRQHAEAISHRLDGLEKRANNLLRRRVTASLAPALILRQHIDGLRGRLRRYTGGGPGAMAA